MRRKRNYFAFAAAAAAAFVFATVQAQGEGSLTSGPGVGLVQQKCAMCHEINHILRSRLSRGEWVDNLKLMKERGAPLEDAETAVILDYLTTYYGRTPAPPPAPDTHASATPAPGGTSADIQALLNAHACSACHASDKRLVGPSFREVSARYAGDRDAAAKLAQKIRSGGAGNWGQVPMPPTTEPSDSELRKLIEYILAQK